MTATMLVRDAVAPIPDYAEPIEAWRAWRVGPHGGEVVLESLFAVATWEPGIPLTATCAVGHRLRWRPWRYRLNEHDSPQLDCTCGIYGVPTEAAAREYLDQRRFVARGERVFGRVALWGEAIECEAGWRASYAYPLELYVVLTPAEIRGPRHRAYLDEIAFGLQAYGVPVEFAVAGAVVGGARRPR